MDWEQYQLQAMRTKNVSPSLRERLIMGALGLSGEAGEVTDTIKKIAFHDHELDYATITEELGDVLWYIAYLLDALDLSMEDVLERNIAKLRARYPDGFDGQRSRNRTDL